LVVFLASLTMLTAVAGPVAARATKQDELTADLDGTPIVLVEVGNWYCHDFDYPAIHCFSDPAQLIDSSAAAQSRMKDRALKAGNFQVALAGVTYVTVFEYTSYQGAFMQMSENYSILSLIGWNDRISSFKVRNNLSGAFWADWLYTGTKYNFCCNQELGSLGSYNDTFSSVYHN
jgi:hypothetical protein